jgi:hypothetical protein
MDEKKEINGIIYETQEAFDQEKRKLLEQKIVLIEIAPNKYRTRLYD